MAYDTNLSLFQRTTSMSDSTDEFLELIRDPFKQTITTNAFWIALGTSLGFTVVIGILFSLIRPHHNVVYAPKLKYADDRHAPPPLGRGIFSWVVPLWKTKETEVVYKSGLDADIFLRFTRMLRNLFLVMSFIGCGVMIPVNVTKNWDAAQLSDFTLMTPQNVWGEAIWSHVVCTWFFDITVCFFLWWNYRAVRKLKARFFRSPEYQMSLHARTLMVTDIPQPYRNDEAILRLTDQVNPTSGIPRVVTGRNTKELPDLIEKHEEAVRQLESVLAKYLKKPDNLPPKRPVIKVKHGLNKGEKVDAIEYLTDKINQLEVRIRDMRETIDKRNALPYAFASWDRIMDAHKVAYNARTKHPQGIKIVLAPRPNDIIWPNLPLSAKARRWKHFVNNLWVALLTIVWIVPNAMIAIFLTNLSNLGAVWPTFQRQLNLHPKAWAAVQGIASPAITSLFYLVLPIIFRRLAIVAGEKTKSARERLVTHQLYAFFVFNNLLVFSLFSAVWQFVSSVIDAEQNHSDIFTSIKNGDLFTNLMVSLCTVSPFWVTWLLQRNLGAAIDLAQLLNLTGAWFSKTFMSPTPRQWIEWTAPPPFDYASYYNYFLFYATVALCFATLQPIVLPVTALYFAVDSILKKYLLMYVFVTKTESGGQFWRVLVNRMLFAVFLANVIIALIAKTRGTWGMLFAMVPLPFLLLAFKWYCSKHFEEQCTYYNRSGIIDDTENAVFGREKASSNKVAVRFGDPALHKALMVPMVHAKAQHVLSKIYSGRLHEDSFIRADDAGVVMDDMSHALPGKTARFVDAKSKAATTPFEIVPESQLDFSYYKDRAEFGQDHGAGEIYGKPEDLISERSHTPRSYSGDDSSRTLLSSRESSPPSTYQVNPMFPSTVSESSHGDLGIRAGVPRGTAYYGYNSWADDTATHDHDALLSSAQPVPEIMPPSRPQYQYGQGGWRRAHAGYTPVEHEDSLSYDYFRQEH